MPGSKKQAPQHEGPGRGSPLSRTLARPTIRAGRPIATDAAKNTLLGNGSPLDEQAASPIADPLRRGARGLAGFFWVIIAVAVMFVAMYGSNFLRWKNQQAAVADATAEIQRLEASISTLEDELARWQNPEYIQVQARERLGWVMPGEIGFIVLGPDGQPLGAGTPIQRSGTLPEDEHPQVWFERLWLSVGTADNPEPAPKQPDVVTEQPR
ncbi:MAG: septum formation initiator family protein [Propionibacteriaceae bacterium]|nr:septum formation initiator family protein [Propionibacteriaceae bacterium]